MKRLLTYTLLMITMLVSWMGCDVHEFPEEHRNLVPFELHLAFDRELPLYKEIVYTRSTEEEEMAMAAAHDIRYIIKAYCVDNSRSDNRQEDSTYVFTKSDIANLDYTARFDIREGTYCFRVWADYVDAGSERDKYYTTDDFSKIMLSDRNNHPGSNDYRDAFRGETTATVVDKHYYTDVVAKSIDNTARVEMRRPMGKFSIVSTDVDVFLTRVEEMMKEQGLLVGSDHPLGQTAKEQLLQNIKWSDYQVIIRYNMFMPCSFNNFTNKPADSWTGMSFRSTMQPQEDNTIRIAFDYIFVNGNETTINLSVEVYDSNGILLSSSRPIDVPIVRSKHTLVSGAFLTTKASGGVSISPGYEGDDYNIEIK